MSSIANFEAAQKLVTQPGSLLEVGQVDVAGQSLLGYVNAPGSVETFGCWPPATVMPNTWFTWTSACPTGMPPHR